MPMDDMASRMGALSRMSGSNPGDALRSMVESKEAPAADVVTRVETLEDNPRFVAELEQLLAKYEGGGAPPPAEGAAPPPEME